MQLSPFLQTLKGIKAAKKSMNDNKFREKGLPRVIVLLARLADMISFNSSDINR